MVLRAGLCGLPQRVQTGCRPRRVGYGPAYAAIGYMNHILFSIGPRGPRWRRRGRVSSTKFSSSLLRRASDLRTSRPETPRAAQHPRLSDLLAVVGFTSVRPFGAHDDAQSLTMTLTRTRPTDWRRAVAGARPRRRDRATRSRRSRRPHSGCPSPSTSHPWASHQAARAMAALSLLDDRPRRAPSALEPAVLAPEVQPPS